MVSFEEIGSIFCRIAVEDDAFLAAVLGAARKNSQVILEADLEKLRKWVKMIRLMRLTRP